MTPPKTFRVGIVGAGYVSQFHVSALRRLPNVQIIGICDRDPERAETAAREFGLKPFASLGELVAAGVEVVHILTPPATHAALTIEALECGCHVFVEKPLATNVEDCVRIADAAKAAKKIVGVNHSLLRDPFVVRALALARSGAVGDVVAVDWLRSSDYPPYRGGALPPQYRSGGYPFRDLGVHGLYLLQEFLGEIQNVTAEFRNAGLRNGDANITYDEWRAVVRCARGTGQLQLSWNVRPVQNVLIIQGSRGVIRADLFNMFVTLKRNTPLPKAVERVFNAMNEGRQIVTQVPLNLLRFVGKKILPYHGLQMFVAEFYASLAADKPALVTPEQARPVVDWTERVAREADTAKTNYLSKFPSTLTAKNLVTGASGFIGRALVKRLVSENQRVRVFVRRAPSDWMNHPQIEIVLGDLGDPDAVERAVAGTDLIYHVGAAMSGAGHDFERGTVVGTRNVIKSALKHRVGKVVYVSSLSVLHAAAAQTGQRMAEDWPLELHPQNRGHYTQTKLDAERLVMEAVRDGKLNAVILRPGQVFGPGAPVLTPAVARRVKNCFVILGDGKLALPLVYVEDVVDALLLAAQRDDARGKIFHLVDADFEVTQDELLAQYLAATKLGAVAIHVPRAVVYFLALGVQTLAALLRRTAPLSIYRVKSALAPISFDCTAAEQQLGWKPRVGVASGLKESLAVTKP